MFSVLKRASAIFTVLAIINAVISIGTFIVLEETYNMFSHNIDLLFFDICLIVQLFSTPALFAGLSVIFKLLYKDLVSQDIHNALKFKDLKSDPTSK